MSRSRNLGDLTRYQWFESGFLQQRVEAGDAAFPERRETFPKKGETAEIWRCIDTLSCAA